MEDHLLEIRNPGLDPICPSKVTSDVTSSRHVLMRILTHPFRDRPLPIMITHCDA